jgi:nucleoside-diphosphate-sugar epimerase
MKKILITGGAGFVGRHFTKFFLDKGDDVWCVDNITPLTGGIEPNNWPLYNPLDYDNFKFLKEDCRNFFKNNNDTDFDIVIHLAAMVGGREMIENNPLVVAEDLSIDSMYWKWAVKTKPKKTICFSSSAAYPVEYQMKDNYRLLKEDMISFDSNIGMPDMSYGWAKLTHEYLAKLAYQKHGINSVTYRPFSGYGEDQDLAYPFPSICKRVIENKNNLKLNVWGTGHQMRDFIHISDCVNGVISTMDKVNDGSPINLSTGVLTSFIEFTKMAADISGYNPKVSGNSTKPEGVFARGGDTQLQESLGFIPKVDFKTGIKRAISYFER